LLNYYRGLTRDSQPRVFCYLEFLSDSDPSSVNYARFSALKWHVIMEQVTGGSVRLFKSQGYSLFHHELPCGERQGHLSLGTHPSIPFSLTG
jgi:hypothetical protein